MLTGVGVGNGDEKNKWQFYAVYCVPEILRFWFFLKNPCVNIVDCKNCAHTFNSCLSFTQYLARIYTQW